MLVTLTGQLWGRFPLLARRFSRTLTAVLSDGRYIQAWPLVAVVAPLTVLALGLVLGSRDQEVYTFSVSTMALLALVSGLGAAFGLWAWTGFVIGDLLLRDPQASSVFLDATSPLTQVYAPLLIAYSLLAGLLVLSPLLGSEFRAGFDRALQRRSAASRTGGFLIQALVQGGYAVAWIHALPFLIRPIWSYRGPFAFAPTAATAPLQANGWIVVAAVLAGVAARETLTALSANRRAHNSAADVGATATSTGIKTMRLPAWMLVPLKAAFITLLFSGLFTDRTQAALVGLALTAILGFRTWVMPRTGALVSSIHRVPLLVRVIAAVMAAYVLGRAIVLPAVQGGETSFSPMIVSVLLSLAIASILLPASVQTRSAPTKPPSDISTNPTT